MCISCACNEPEATHDNPKNITLQAFKDAANAADVDLPQLLKNIGNGFERFGGAEKK